MTIADAQRMVDEWISGAGGYFPHLTNMAILSEEVGEVARIISRTYGRQVAKPGDLKHSLSEELADVMWVVICLANQSGIDLTEALLQGLEKRERRDTHRFDIQKEDQ